MISPDIMTVPAAGQDFYGKTAGELIGNNIKVYADGCVTGTLYYVTGYTGFNETVAAEQEGFFFPLCLAQPGSKMSFYKNGKLTKKDIAWEAYNVFRVSASDCYEIKVDGKKVFSLTFAGAVFKD